MEAKPVRLLFLLFATLLIVAGCGRASSDKSKDQANDLHVQPGTAPVESDDWGYLRLKIARVHMNQKPLEQAPWHEAGGDWTFLECQSAKQASVRVLIGTRDGRPTTVGETKISMAWGEAIVAVTDRAVGTKFVETFARSFHQSLPPSHGDQPVGYFRVHTSVLGSEMGRDPKGGFSGKGDWTATKWFLSDDKLGEAEVFFNYSLKEKRAEFSEKDSDYREPLIGQLVVALRDGPLPERTPENDPTLTRTGPGVANWKKLEEGQTRGSFTPDSKNILLVVSTNDSTRFLVREVQGSQTKTLAKFDRLASITQTIGEGERTAFLVTEILAEKGQKITYPGPQQLWWLELASGQKKLLEIPEALTNWYTSEGAVSPDGNFVALHQWQKPSGKQRVRSIHLLNRETAAWRKIELPGTTLQLVGWRPDKREGIVLAGNPYDKQTERKAYALDPVTGTLSALNAVPLEFASGTILSPDKHQSVRVQGKERLSFTQLAAQPREFVFHPYDRQYVYDEGVFSWADSRYLVFQGDRTALIDSQTLKMNFVSPKESPFGSVSFSPDFKWALANKDDGCYLGQVELSAGR
jgi:hypothetical protein